MKLDGSDYLHSGPRFITRGIHIVKIKSQRIVKIVAKSSRMLVLIESYYNAWKDCNWYPESIHCTHVAPLTAPSR